MKNWKLLLLYVCVLAVMAWFIQAPVQRSSVPVKPVPEDTSPMVVLQRKSGVEEIALETYLLGVVGSEMPASFALEALKAQSVAARTFVVSRGYQVDDTTATQAYHSVAELKKIWGSDFAKRYEKIQEAVQSTAGEIMTYDGYVISALYFSTSNGKTANSEDYYASTLPYLRSVDSPWDLTLNPNALQEEFFTFAQLKEKLALTKNASTFQIISRYDDGRIKEAKVNGASFTGREIREKLGLKSSDFTVTKTKNGFQIVTTGYGHGVGMSQYGAQGMALEGSSYDTILKHYYQNIEIIAISSYKR